VQDEKLYLIFKGNLVDFAEINKTRSLQSSSENILNDFATMFRWFHIEHLQSDLGMQTVLEFLNFAYMCHMFVLIVS